jgi:hypothetical protein
MKPLLSFVLLALCLRLEAQISSGQPGQISGFTSASVKVGKDNSYKASFINNVPAVVMKDFFSRYDEHAVSWFVEDRDVTGYFYEEDVYHVIYYQNNMFLKTRSLYDSSHLSTSVYDFLQRELGKKKYKINLVTEVNWEDLRLYEISLVNGKKTCVVKIAANKDDANLSILDKTFMTEQ